MINHGIAVPGLCWDRIRPATQLQANRIPECSAWMPVGTGECLFDFETKTRTIPLSAMLGWNSLQNLKPWLSELSDCEAVAIVTDYVPTRGNPTIDAFYNLRVRQVLGYFESVFAEASVFLLLDPLSSVRSAHEA